MKKINGVLRSEGMNKITLKEIYTKLKKKKKGI